MSGHYKRDAASNRDALFGGGGGGGGKGSRSGGGGGRGARPTTTTSKPSSYSSSSGVRKAGGGNSGGGGGSADGYVRSASSASSDGGNGSGGYVSTRARLKQGGNTLSVLSGTAKVEKMKEAEEYRQKAKKAMAKGVFSRPDPIAAGNFYKRAADAYKQCGENRLERLHRIASGDCQMGQGAYATAATEYTRAAELAEISDETIERKRQECRKLHSDAAEAWRQQGELGRAGESQMKAAFGTLIGTDDGDGDGDGFESQRSKPKMTKMSLEAIEEAIESFLPDPLNRYRDHRRTGRSAYVDPNADPNDVESKQTMLELAKQNVVTTSYSHEPVFKAVFCLIKYGEYGSALYGAGAATALLSHDGFATISLSRAYCTETIITLAIGDVVAADRSFMDVHLQQNSYLSSRECKLAEDLIRAVKTMDAEALEEARSPSGSNRAALANLDPALRGLVREVRVSGRASSKGKPKKAAPARPAAADRRPPASSSAAPRPSAPSRPSVERRKDKVPPEEAVPVGELDGDELKESLDANYAEMDELMGDMGLDSEEEDDEDDDIDLR